MPCALRLFGGALWEHAVGTDLGDTRGPLYALADIFAVGPMIPRCVKHAERMDRGAGATPHMH